MTSEQFIERIRTAVYESTADDIVSILRNPPGRKPSTNLVALSAWFNQLSPEDEEQVRRVIQLSVRDAVFGMLAVIDGVASIRELGEEEGSLELRFISPTRSVVLNDSSGEFLHDLFAEQVPPL